MLPLRAVPNSRPVAIASCDIHTPADSMALPFPSSSRVVIQQQVAMALATMKAAPSPSESEANPPAVGCFMSTCANPPASACGSSSCRKLWADKASASAPAAASAAVQRVGSGAKQETGRSRRSGGASGGSKTRLFLPSLYQMCNNDDENHRQCICWSDDGSTFWVSNTEKFSRLILPMYFRHNNYASFVRQLNMCGSPPPGCVPAVDIARHPLTCQASAHPLTQLNPTPPIFRYGFQRSTESKGKVKPGVPMVEHFTHQFFVRGREDLLGNIHRKTSSVEKASAAAPVSASAVSTTPRKVEHLESELRVAAAVKVRMQADIEQLKQQMMSMQYRMAALERDRAAEPGQPSKRRRRDGAADGAGEMQQTEGIVGVLHTELDRLSHLKSSVNKLHTMFANTDGGQQPDSACVAKVMQEMQMASTTGHGMAL